MRLGLVSDVHWMAEPPAVSSGWHGTGAEFRGVLGRLERALALFAGERVDVIALAGDLAHDGDEASIIAVLRCCAGAVAPVLVVSGNHDVAGDPGRLERAHWRADASGVVLASTRGELYSGVRVAGVHVGETDGWFGAQLSSLPETDEWAVEPVVLVSHYPAISLASEVSARGFPYPGDLVDRQALADRLLRRDAPTIVVGGHVHARASRREGPTLQLTGGAVVETPFECAIVEARSETDGSLVVSRTSRRLLPPTGGREPVFAPDRESWRYSPVENWSSHAREAEASAVW